MLEFKCGTVVHIPAMSLFYWLTTLGKLFTHIASPVFSAPRNWGTKENFRTGLLEWLNGLNVLD